MNNAEAFIIEILKLGACNATQIEALTEAIDGLLAEAGISVKGELKARTNLIIEQKTAQHEKVAIEKMKQEKKSRKYPDLNKLPHKIFGEQQ